MINNTLHFQDSLPDSYRGLTIIRKLWRFKGLEAEDRDQLARLGLWLLAVMSISAGLLLQASSLAGLGNPVQDGALSGWERGILAIVMGIVLSLAAQTPPIIRDRLAPFTLFVMSLVIALDHKEPGFSALLVLLACVLVALHWGIKIALACLVTYVIGLTVGGALVHDWFLHGAPGANDWLIIQLSQLLIWNGTALIAMVGLTAGLAELKQLVVRDKRSLREHHEAQRLLLSSIDSSYGQKIQQLQGAMNALPDHPQDLADLRNAIRGLKNLIAEAPALGPEGADRSTPHPTPVSANTLPETPYRGIKVLIVDDDHIVRRATALVLMRLGADIVEASTATQALLRMHQHETVDLVLSDLNMPSGDGISLKQSLDKNHSGIPFVLLSGSVTAEQLAEISAHHALVVLSKPFNRAKALALFQRYRDRWHTPSGVTIGGLAP